MTRKLALQEAIQIIENTGIEPQKKAEIIKGLQLCVDELPFILSLKRPFFIPKNGGDYK